MRSVLAAAMRSATTRRHELTFRARGLELDAGRKVNRRIAQSTGIDAYARWPRTPFAMPTAVEQSPHPVIGLSRLQRLMALARTAARHCPLEFGHSALA